MGEKSETTVIGSLPHSRPQRRSAKRAPRPAPQEQRAAPQQQPRSHCPGSLPDGGELLGTVVKATAELAEIGFTLGARALRTAVARLPRP